MLNISINVGFLFKAFDELAALSDITRCIQMGMIGIADSQWPQPMSVLLIKQAPCPTVSSANEVRDKLQEIYSHLMHHYDDGARRFIDVAAGLCGHYFSVAKRSGMLAREIVTAMHQVSYSTCLPVY